MNNQTGQILAEPKRTALEFFAEKCVHKLFEFEAKRDPERIAIVHGGKKITYAELNLSANRLAHYLISKGVRNESLVSIAMERSPELIVCILGVLKAGGAYLPLDPGYPRERLAAIIDDAKTSVLLTTSSLANKIPFDDPHMICVDDLEFSDENTENPDIAIKSSDLAYVMYTSGSTGIPKGVMVEHRSIVRLVRDTDYADFGADNVFLQFAPITFDASTFEIWGALLNGARLAIMPEGRASLEDLGNAIRQYEVTTLWLTAGLFHLMVDERINDLRPLRQLLAGGDVLSVTHVQKVLRALDCDLINGYGPTENTTFTCTYKVPRDAELAKSVPIGKPIANTQVIILDEDRKPVAKGESGELYVGGAGLARGYFNAPELTAERFVRNPFGDIPSSKLYRSGDLVRTLPDGNIEFLGRADKQVKIRGYRIELEEIEFSLMAQQGIREAIAVAKDISPAEKQLIAFIVPEANSFVDIAQVRTTLQAVLPEYMIPAFIFSLEALPLTANGKVDRAALIGMVSSGTKSRPSFAGPESESEAKIALLLEEILANGPVGTNDNFFDLGANSLQMARFHSRLQTAFGLEIKMVSLFQNPSVRLLAASIGGNGSRTRNTDVHDRAMRQREAFASRRQVLNRGN